MKKVLVIGDVHAPFHCETTLKRVYSAIFKERPQIVIQIGDVYDFFSFSRFPKKPGIISPQDEIEKAHDVIEEMWITIRRMVPRAECYQLLGNHSVRPLKLTIERCPDLYPLVEKSWKELYKFQGVQSLLNTRDDLEIDGVIYEHGYLTRPGHHMRYNMKSTVFGHLHRGWVHFEQIRNKMMFDMCVGYVANPEAQALQYTPKKYVSWTKGYGLVDSNGPRFIALP